MFLMLLNIELAQYYLNISILHESQFLTQLVVVFIQKVLWNGRLPVFDQQLRERTPLMVIKVNLAN
jgi:hypothetical protein